MNTGMLWFDNRNRPLVEVLLEANSYYQQKYGATPDVAFVNPSAIERETVINGLTVKPMKEVLKKHIWIGKSAEPEQKELFD